MVNPLDDSLNRLLKDCGAQAAVIWVRHNHSSAGTVVASCPAGLLPSGTSWPIIDESESEGIERDPSRLAALVPTTLRLQLEGQPEAAALFALSGGDLSLLIVWCDATVPVTLSENCLRFIREDIADLAVMTSDSRFNAGELKRLHAVLEQMNMGMVSVDPGIGLARANTAAAELLRLRVGANTVSAFSTAMSHLAERTLNQPEIAEALWQLQMDPTGEVDAIWRFGQAPTHVRVVSRPVRQEGVDTRVWYFSDISELSGARESVERSQQELRAILDAMLNPQILVDVVLDSGGEVADLVYRDVNQAFCRYIGLTRAQLVDHSLLRSYPGLVETGLVARYAHCSATGEPIALDSFPYVDESSGETRYYDIRGARIRPGSITLTFHDNTARFNAATALAASEEHFRLIAENIGDVVLHVSEDGIILWVSPSVEAALGKPADYWVGRSIIDYLPAEDLPIAAGIIDDARQGLVVVRRIRVLNADGVPHWVEFHAKQFINAEGMADGFSSSFRVIDDEVAAEKELDEARRRRAEADAIYRRSMDSTAVGTCLARTDGTFIEVNDALCAFFGYDADELLQKTWIELTDPEYVAADMAMAAELVAGRIETYHMQKKFIHASGRPIWGHLYVADLRRLDGDVLTVLGQIVDITDEVEARHSVERYRRLMENSSVSMGFTVTGRIDTYRDIRPYLHADGHQVWADVSVGSLQGPDGKPENLFVQLVDISDRVAAEQRLRAEIASAADYVRSVLPGPLSGPVDVTSRFLPSSELGGDCYDYAWIDDDHLMMYLIDVSGHGIEPAMVSVSVHEMLRSGSISTETRLAPDRLLAKLNRRFAMDDHHDHYLTIWYGVYEKSTRTMSYAGAGHPPALVFAGDTVTPLPSQSLPVGMFADTEFTSDRHQMPAGARILLYSDGAYEFTLAGGEQFSVEQFSDLCAEAVAYRDFSLDALVSRLRNLAATGDCDDDCSLVLAEFD